MARISGIAECKGTMNGGLRFRGLVETPYECEFFLLAGMLNH